MHSSQSFVSCTRFLFWLFDCLIHDNNPIFFLDHFKNNTTLPNNFDFFHVTHKMKEGINLYTVYEGSGGESELNDADYGTTHPA